MPNGYQKYLLNQINQAKNVDQLADLPLEPGDFVRLFQLEGSARALLAVQLLQRKNRPVLAVTADPENSEHWWDDARFFGLDDALHFPLPETLPYETDEPIVEIVARQYSALWRLTTGERADVLKPQPPESTPPFLTAPVEALQTRVPSAEALRELILPIDWGSEIEEEALAQKLTAMGYDRQGMAETRGEFSIRGHIVDIFSPQYEFPLRLDLFDREIESIRFYDPSTQRSLPEQQEIERVLILPVSISALWERLAREDAENPDAPKRLVCLLDLLPEDTLVVLDRSDKYDAILERFDGIALRRFEELSGTRPLPETAEFSEAMDGPNLPGGAALSPECRYVSRSALQAAFSRFAQLILPPLKTADVEEGGGDFVFDCRAYDTVKPDIEAWMSLLKSRQQEDYSIHIVCDNEGQLTRFKELLNEREMDSRIVLPQHVEESRFESRNLLAGYQDIILTTGLLHTGFIFPEARLLMVTDREIFGRYKRRHVYRKAYKGKAVSSPTDIARGDYVVHVDHGMGRFMGIRHQTIDGQETELLEIEYANDDKLLVPIAQVNRVQKYSSTEGAAPALDSLGSKRWQTRKKKSQERIEQMARELLDIYARREAAQGFACSADTVWQQEFEDAFLYQETPDQLRSIAEIKEDMESAKPMDRLLCGDVGFGKTEVAMRAAFKAVQNKKQVAVLAPTTILAQQHFTSFKERFADYPVGIEMLSRFRTPTEQRESLKKIKNGEADILIGTHRLVSKDVHFADLGLVIVDEEHRFGVAQKERLKALKSSVDILTLSATPIPRTLHLALSGLRDMSAINTPPRDRLPVRTSVIRFSPRDIEEAVMRELNRGGQIYFVHNRVQSIQQVAENLRKIVPQARIAIGHGQMPERDLEKVMFDFIDRKSDILLATTIIESGLDIPNVNTIIINRADAFGLAQLYQLRGRVGRDVKRAYAYLIVPQGQAITDTAVKRLRAIEEFTELGMGFQVAMRDLEIRGTGNLLGPEQHGAIDGVGFELYCSMLEEAVRRLRGEGGMSDEPVEIHWDLPAFLPSRYVPVEAQRVSIYKKLAAAREVQEMDALQEELRDRYGQLPSAAEQLLAVTRLRILAQQAGIKKIHCREEGFALTPCGALYDFLRHALPLQERSKVLEKIEADAQGRVVFQVRKWSPSKGLPFLEKILTALK